MPPITVNVNRFELVADKRFEARRELLIRFADAKLLDGVFELVSADISILSSISFWDERTAEPNSWCDRSTPTKHYLAYVRRIIFSVVFVGTW